MVDNRWMDTHTHTLFYFYLCEDIHRPITPHTHSKTPPTVSLWYYSANLNLLLTLLLLLSLLPSLLPPSPPPPGTWLADGSHEADQRDVGGSS